jgi:hypothetical protein
MLQIRHYICSDLITRTTDISFEGLFRLNSTTTLASFHLSTSLSLPLLGKLSSLLAELARTKKIKY